MAVLGRAAFLLVVCTTASCAASWERGLGHRARAAAIRGDVDAFRSLMMEASETTPQHPRDNPTRTVLSHFLDLAADDRYFPTIEEWTQNGWVPDAMTCAIHRARHRALAETNPVEASRAARVCIERARTASADGARSWELDACLEDASFLTSTSTLALAPYLRIAADPTESRLLRERVLAGMTQIFLRDAWTRRANDPSLSLVNARHLAKEEFERMRSRHDAIVAAVTPTTDVALLAAGTAFGALEIERVAMEFGRSLIARHASSPAPASRDLAWAWARWAKAKKKVPRLEALGIWRSSLEPRGDAYWYMCVASSEPTGAGGARAMAVRADAAIGSERVREFCARDANFEAREIVGPHPIAATLRLAAIAVIGRGQGDVDVERTVDIDGRDLGTGE